MIFDLQFSFPDEDASEFNFRTDPEKLKLILSNLINNAVKFSSNDSTITLKIWIEERQLFVSVHDKGLEITDDYKQLIFDRFKRVDTTITSVNRGHGLGLSIIKSLLDLLEGDISFHSDKEKGVTFTIHIPEAVEAEDSFNSSLNGNELFFEEDNQVF